MNVPIVRKVLEKNDAAAAQNRERFDRLGLTCVDLLGGAGSGKTALLEAVLPILTRNLRVAVLEGDIATTRDAERIAALGVPVVQLTTEGGCHLTAPHVQRALGELTLDELDLLIIENVGNPICPANFALGEHARVALLSVAEGDDKPAKYPLLFRGADLVVISKCDLLPHVDFNLAAAKTDLRRVNAAAPLLETSARCGTGIDRLAAWLAHLVGSALRIDAAGSAVRTNRK
ncbi:Hydrogenase isoenzymes nickel incorporation protein HypB [Phycisphaerae bacterium RAS1]|nr:Hydrogenase isoenzymes nickel incorporation protein HypB [Phycisphaerae bacterium RAS1]